MVVVVGGKYPTPCKKGEGLVRAEKMSGEHVWGEYVHGKCPDPLDVTLEVVTFFDCWWPPPTTLFDVCFQSSVVRAAE